MHKFITRELVDFAVDNVLTAYPSGSEPCSFNSLTTSRDDGNDVVKLHILTNHMRAAVQQKKKKIVNDELRATSCPKQPDVDIYIDTINK